MNTLCVKEFNEIKVLEENLTPFSVCLAYDNNILIVDNISHQVVLSDMKGNSIWKRNRNDCNFYYPTDALFFNDHFYIVDSYNHRIVVLNKKGEMTSSFGSFGSDDEFFNQPFGIASFDNKSIIISDVGNVKLKIMALDGKILSSFGAKGFFKSYYESGFFKRQMVFKKWQIAQTSYNTLESMFFSTGFKCGDLEHPQGIAWIDKKTVAVADMTGFILIFDLESNKMIKSYQCEKYPTWLFYHQNELYFSCEFSNILFKIDESGNINPYKKIDKEIGKFIINKNADLVFISPWKKKIYTIKLS